MKLQTPSSSRRKIVSVLLVVLGLLLGYAIYRLVQPTPAPQTASSPATAQTPTPAPKPAAPSMIEIAAGITVAPAPGDYTADDHIWRLVNKTNPLTDKQYRPAALALPSVATRTDKSQDERSVRTDIIPHVEALFAAAKAAGHDLKIGSGFRGYQLQQFYYTNYVRTYGQASADRFSARPGQSEHQTGLAIDLTTTDHVCYLEECFGETPAGKWLAAHAHEHGFILRYHKGKESITGYQYEPWHFRYVGKELATAIWRSGLAYEEVAPRLLEYATKAQSSAR